MSSSDIDVDTLQPLEGSLYLLDYSIKLCVSLLDCDDVQSCRWLPFRSKKTARCHNLEDHDAHFYRACAVEDSHVFHKSVLLTLSKALSKSMKNG
jgi:hypothetical protein